jgi:PTH1 family peptidyl-tRNA hydrolase
MEMSYTARVFWRRTRVPGPAFIVFGLGNPGLNYMRSRHNVGWWVLDELVRRHAVERTLHRHKGQADLCSIGGISAALVKPTTFMNRSGQCVGPWLREYPEAGFAVVYDDITMRTGKVRLRDEGRAGGHNGVKSIIDALRREQFDRVKVGVGAPEGVDAADYVLEHPSKSELELLQPAIACAADALEQLIRNDRVEALAVIARLAQTQPADQPADPGK